MSGFSTSPVTAAIDVGFRNVKFRWTGGRGEYSGEFPSMLGDFDPTMAEAWGGKKPEGVLLRLGGSDYFVGKDAHIFSKVNATRRFDPRYSQTVPYKAFHLGALAHIALAEGSDHLQIAMLCCALPLNTWAECRADLKSMTVGRHVIEIPGRKDPIHIDVKDAMVIRQPQGALFSQGVQAFRSNAAKTTLVCDIGGGTTDFFLSIGSLSLVDRSSCIPFGMIECAESVAEAIRPGLGRKSLIVKRIDDALARHDREVLLDGGPVGIPVRVVQARMAEIFDQVAQGVRDFSDIDRILITGGGARHLAPVFKQHLPDRASTIEVDDDPISTNCRGFLRVAEYALNGDSA